MMRTRPVLPLAVVSLLWTQALRSQEAPAAFDTLTLEKAVAFALEYNPEMRAAGAAIRGASAATRETESNYYPSLSAFGTVTRNDGWFVFNPSFPPRLQVYNNYSTGLQLQQTLFDFGRTISRVNAGGNLEEATRDDYYSTRGTVIVNVQVAYFNYLQARSLVAVNEEALAAANKHLAEAKAFYTVGRRPQFDVTKAEVDVANANVNLIAARNGVSVAKVQLDNAMGIHPANAYALSDSVSVGPVVMSLDSAKALAMQQRPEILAAQARLSANASLVTAAQTQHLPILSLTGAYSWAAFDLPLYGRWNAGITFTLPIFQGFAVSAGVEQAEANEDAARANLDVASESVRLDVEQSYLSVQQAVEQIAATTKLVEQAAENLNLAERQYAAGVGTPLDVSDAQLSLSNARITRIQAQFSYNSSVVRLQRAVGLIR